MILDTSPGWVGWVITDKSLAEQGILDTSPGGQGDSRYKSRRVGWAITDKSLAEQGILDNSPGGHGGRLVIKVQEGVGSWIKVQEVEGC